MPSETSAPDLRSVARTLLKHGIVVTNFIDILTTNVDDLEPAGQTLHGHQALFVPNGVLEEVGFPVPVDTPTGNTTTLGTLEAHFAGPDKNGIPLSSFDLQQVQRTASGEIVQTVRADLMKDHAYLVKVEGDFLLMPPPSAVVGKYLDVTGISDVRLYRPASPGEATPVVHDSLVIQPNRVAALLREFPEIQDLTAQGEISISQLERIERDRRAIRGR